jgi:hypothetical protein
MRLTYRHELHGMSHEEADAHEAQRRVPVLVVHSASLADLASAEQELDPLSLARGT